MKHIYVLFLVLLFIACSEEKQTDYIQLKGFAQGTTYTITYKDSLGRNFQAEVDSMLVLIDNSVSTYKSGSLINQFNQLQDTSVWFDLDEIFYQNLILSKHIYKQTNGAFDPTVGPLFQYFDFDNGGVSSIDTTEIQLILQNSIGLNLIKLNTENKTARKTKPNVTLNFNAIAQGFSVDLIAANFDALNINDYMIEVGGEVLVKGNNPNHSVWRLGIDAPKENSKPGESFQKIVELSNKALATSGNYRKFYKIGDKKYSHTLNPETGFPVSHNLLSTSVLANTCAEADAYATAFMVLGVDESLYIIENNGVDVEAYFVSSDSGILIEKETKGFQLN